MSPEYSFPQIIDVNPTAKCNLACDFCYGPYHETPDALSTQQWLDIFDFFAQGGTEAIVFTGGDPLIRRDIGTLMQGAKELQYETTLSSNTLLLPRKAKKVLPYTDKIGIPTDGSTPEKHALMRNGRKGKESFTASLSAQKIVREFNPDIEITMRTVVSNVNLDDIGAIGDLLETRTELFDRWKLYQFAPVSIGAEQRDKHEISDNVFTKTITQLQSRYDFPIVGQSNQQRVGRYIFVDPQGGIFGVDNKGDYKTVAHFSHDAPEKIIENMTTIFCAERNAIHVMDS